MRTQDTGGFTIVEVVIFLAISALMISIAIVGVSNSISSARFTDTVRSFESFMQRQYDETLNGVNSRTGNEVCNSAGEVTEGPLSVPGASNNCLLLGKYLSFTKGSSLVRVHYVVGTHPSSLTSTDGDAAAIVKAKPHVVKGSTEKEFEIPWQAGVYDTRRDDNKAINGVALVRSPKSSSIYTYTFYTPAVPDDLTALLTPGNTNRQTNICVKSKDVLSVYGAITLAKGGRGQDAIGSRLDISDSNLASVCEGVL